MHNTTFNPDSVFLKEEYVPETEPTTSAESLLYPELPNDYFKDKEDAISTEKSGIHSVVEKYENAKVKPYVSVSDLNNSSDLPYENKPKIGYEFGIKFSF